MKSMITSREKENFSKISDVDFSICFFGSWRKKIIETTFRKMITVHATIDPAIPAKFDRRAPSAGPMRNQSPNIAPMSPIFLVRESFDEISDIYACTTQNPAHPRPPIHRDMRNTIEKNPNPHQRVVAWTDIIGACQTANSIIIYQRRFSDEVMTSIFLRPYLSESPQNTSHPINIPSAYIPCV